MTPKIERNTIVVSYKHAPAFVITCKEHGCLSRQEIIDACKSYYRNLYGRDCFVRIVDNICSFSTIEVTTPHNEILKLDWSYHTNVITYDTERT